jgi:hypothetical protein
MRAQGRRLGTVLLVIILFFAACHGASSSKGPEDDIDDEGKFDSFYAPTEHGQLSFSEAHEASVSDDELYHAWDFEITSPVAIEIEVQLLNLEDSVIYLYRWNDERSSWGSYITRDDDGGEGDGSLIRMDLDVGSYRLMVKGYRRGMRGSFVVLASCDGAGCVDGCDAIEPRPRRTGFGAQCLEPLKTLSEVIATRQSDRDGMTFAERCELSSLERTAVEYVFEDYGPDLDETLEVRTDVIGRTGLTVVTVITEDNWVEHTLLFDDGELVVLQSDDGMGGVAEWFCAGPDDSLPEPWCAEDFFVSSIVTGTTEIESGSASSENIDALPPTARFALDYYRQAHDVGSGVAVELSWEQWEGRSMYLARVSLSADGYPQVTYFTDEYLLMAQVDDSLDFICVNPD